MLGKRRHLRVKGSFRVTWAVQGQHVEGEGVISNISMTGMEMSTRKVFEPAKGSIFLIEPFPDEIIPLQSKKAKVMWSDRMLKDGVDYLQLGLEFIK